LVAANLILSYTVVEANLFLSGEAVHCEDDVNVRSVVNRGDPICAIVQKGGGCEREKKKRKCVF